jgi:hypothetical protein
VFLLLQITVAVTAGEESEEGRKPFRISPVAVLFSAAREPTRHQWRPCMEQTRHRCSYSSRGPLQFLDFLGTVFVIFTCLNMYLNFY